MNLYAMGKALAVYADSNAGQFPPDIDVLVSTGIAEPAELLCPDTPFPRDFDSAVAASVSCHTVSLRLHEILHSCYAYVPGQGVHSDPRNIVMYEKKECHKGKGGNVLFLDGSARWIEPYSKVEEFVGQTKARLAAATRPSGEAGTSSPASGRPAWKD